MDAPTQDALGIKPTVPGMPPPVSPKIPQVQPDPTQAGLEAIQKNYHTQSADLLKQRDEVQAREKEQLKSVPPVEMPSPDFKPMLKDMSAFGGLLMVIGALAGRSTMQPMTAALNNMTGVMKGLKEGDKQLYDMHKAEFERNYKAGMDKYNDFVERRRQIHLDAMGDSAVINQKMQDLYREAGIDIQSQKAMEHGINDTNKAMSEATKQFNNFMLGMEKAYAARFGKGDSAKPPSLGEERAAFQEQNIRQANHDLERLSAAGVKMPVAGDITISGDGVMSATGRYGIKRALTDEEQQMVAAAQLFAEASGHLSSGARLTQAAFEREVREFIQQPGDAPGVIAQKKRNRENVIAAATGISGKTGEKLRAAQDERWKTGGADTSTDHPADIDALVKKYGGQ